MNDKVTASGTTNAEPGTSIDVTAGCSLIWGAAHQFAYIRLSENWKPGSKEVDLLDCYNTRARRIAATYARIYLETEDGKGFDPDKKGRFYWMALGAFASKTVACLLDEGAIELSFAVGKLIKDIRQEIAENSDLAVMPHIILLNQTLDEILSWLDDMVVISEGLGLGNLWLFMDVAVWHWAYANHPNNYFEGMKCEPLRDATKLPKGGVYETVNNHLEWASYALGKINHLQSTDYIREGMGLVEQIEEELDDEKYIDLQMEHLQAIANHEQLAILQPLIYDHPDFKKWLVIERVVKKILRNLESVFQSLSLPLKVNDSLAELIRKIINLFPKYELVFSAGCSTDKPDLKSTAPEDIKVEIPGTLADATHESPKTRLGWIGQAAGKFHGHMKHPIRRKYMENELQSIASWVNEPDFSETCISVEKVSGAFK